MEGALRMMQFVVVVALAITAATAKTITVGGSAGWGLGTNYAQWVANQSVAVGDTLVFNFVSGAHDVALVTKSEYDGCNAAAAAANSLKQPPVNIRVNSTTPLYFLCTFTGHCAGGQKLAVNATGATPNASAPSPQASKAGRTPPPSPSPSGAPPPSSSGAPPPSSSGTEVPPPAASTTPSTPASGPSAAGGGDATPPSPAGSSATSLTGAAGFAAAFLSIAAVAVLN